MFCVDILHGGVEEGGYVEVRPKGVNKGVVSMHIIKNLDKIGNKGRLEFALAIGDDHCDEPMLSVMRQIGRRASEARLSKKDGQPFAPLPATIAQVDVSSCDDYVSAHLQCFTSTVGKKPTAAANYVDDVDDVHELLQSLVKVTTRETVHSGFYSVVDLKGMADIKLRSELKPVLSMGELHSAPGLFVENQPQVGVSTNLHDFLGTIEQDDEEEEDMFF